MRDRAQQFLDGFVLVLGMLIAIDALGSEELAATQDASNSTSEVVAAPVSTPEAVAAPLTGPQVYQAVCIACHAAPGVGGAPALGDRNAWAPRIAQGMDTLIVHALQGFSGSTGVMPRKGDRLDLSDGEVIAAIEYMVEQVAQ